MLYPPSGINKEVVYASINSVWLVGSSWLFTTEMTRRKPVVVRWWPLSYVVSICQ